MGGRRHEGSGRIVFGNSSVLATMATNGCGSGDQNLTVKERPPWTYLIPSASARCEPWQSLLPTPPTCRPRPRFIGRPYNVGQGVHKEAVRAEGLMQATATQGNATTEGYLGSMYLLGDGVPKDASESVKWFAREADQGTVPAETTLAGLHTGGFGIVRCRKVRDSTY